MLEPFLKHYGKTVPLDRANIDTDIIIPKQFLKRLERSGYGKYLMYDWRFLKNGKLNPNFILNQPKYENASILITRENFGSGSSRENAVWALTDYGFKVIIAPSFADIFKGNSIKNGLLLVELNAETIEKLLKNSNDLAPYYLEIDLKKQLVRDDFWWSIEFIIDSFTKEKLLNGWDDISITLQNLEKIKEYEKARLPYWDPVKPL